MTVKITIRNVPEGVRDSLKVRAARRGLSMQEYLHAELEQIASRPSNADLMDEVRARKAADPADISAETILRHKDADKK